MKITVFELEAWERAAFERLGEHHELTLLGEPLSAKTVAEHSDAEAVSTFIYSRLDRRVLEQLPRLKLIATRSTGYDHIEID